MNASAAINIEERLAALRDAAMTLRRQGRFSESLAAHAEALRLAPGSIVILLSAAKLAHAMELQEVSLRYFEEAARLDVRCYQAIEPARRICVGAGLAARAVHYSNLAYELNPSSETQLSLKLLVPSIIESLEELRACRERYARGLEEILAAPPKLDAPQGALGVSAFFLAYHGENDRDLQMRTAQVFLSVIPSLRFTAPHCDRGTRRAGKIRIGLISRFFASHSIFSTSIGLIEKLSREKFEVSVLRITPSREDADTGRARAAADRTVDLDPDVYRAREQIAALELDILFYQDIGMEQTSYFLAFSRLAPVQCVSYGHPNTTGIPTMDYFLSNDWYEPEGAEEHYSERLFLLRGLPTLAYYHPPKVPSATASRASFALPDEGALYVCPQTLFKIHPEFDAILRGILSRDANGWVVLIAGQFQQITQQLIERLRRALPSLAQRILFVPFMPFERFMQLLSLADVILDTVNFNGMNSSLQAFAVGTPVVTLPGRFQRGRHTRAMYLAMGIADCIAADAEHYIDLAVRIGNDPAHAAALREQIAARSPILFENQRVIEEYERFFLEAMRHD